MSYYNPYPYQPMQDQLSQLRQPYQAQTYQPPQQAQMAPPSDPGIIWVQGEAGAKSYPVARGSNVLLMDSESTVFYIKSCDMSGMPSMRAFDYTERTAARGAQIPVNSAGQLEALTARVDALAARVDALTGADGGNVNG